MEGETVTAHTRRAEVAMYDGSPIGVCLYLSSDELSEINFDRTECRIVEYTIDSLNGQQVVHLKKAENQDTLSSTD